MRTLALAVLFPCLACAVATEPSGPARPPSQGPSTAVAGDPKQPATNDDFGNATPAAPTTGGNAGSAAPRIPVMTKPECSPGLYLGTYECEVDLLGVPLPLAGDVSFNLSIDETSVSEDCDLEFCPDLVISKNSGTLFGLAGAIAFEAQLEGALDCKTGEFKAAGIGGKYGNGISTDANDPDALWTVEDPPFGMFDGTLSGMHRTGPPELIEGNWDLLDTTLSGASCNGPFKVVLQPPAP
ncbi:MAG TPA: hypothetical protein VK524_25210 [Polyangiaceae bacterium]|nr:hypothetical protein [Polyangiaceae bacterium]